MIEQYQYIIDNCTVYLLALEKIYTESNDTPPGRMISQLKWLKQEAQREQLPLPLERQYYGTLSHISVEYKYLMEAATKQWDLFHYRLLRLVNGRLLAKPDHNIIVLPLLKYMIENLSQDGAIYKAKLIELETLILSEQNQFPIKDHIFHPTLTIDIYESAEIRKVSNGIQTMEMISEYCFEGVRDLENSPYMMCQCFDVPKPDIIKTT